jgi:hypothetical protein
MPLQGAMTWVSHGTQLESGSVLSVKDGWAIEGHLDLPAAADLERFASRNIPALAKLIPASEGSPHSIIVITGTITARDWDAAIWGIPGTSTPTFRLERTGEIIQLWGRHSIHTSGGHNHNVYQ